MLKAVLVLFMVSSCISRPKEYLIESEDQPGGDYAGDISITNNHPDIHTDGNDYSLGALGDAIQLALKPETIKLKIAFLQALLKQQVDLENA